MSIPPPSGPTSLPPSPAGGESTAVFLDGQFYHCPFPDCRFYHVRWKNHPQLHSHINTDHLANYRLLPPIYFTHFDRLYCSSCNLVHSTARCPPRRIGARTVPPGPPRPRVFRVPRLVSSLPTGAPPPVDVPSPSPGGSSSLLQSPGLHSPSLPCSLALVPSLPVGGSLPLFPGVSPPLPPISLPVSSPALPVTPFPLQISWDDILHSPKRTIKRVPLKVRPLWCQVLTNCLHSFTTNPTEYNLKLLFLLPRCVLSPSPAPGRRFRAASAVKAALEQWQAGQVEALWQAFKLANSSTISPPRSSIQRAKSLARDGLLSRACTALQSAGVHSPSPQVVAALQSKHPFSAPPTPVASTVPAHQFPNALVQDQVLAIKKGASPGPSALRAEHLQDALQCLTPPLAQSFTRALGSFINLLASGSLPAPLFAPFLVCSLIPIKKDTPGPGTHVRPIAIGDIFRRLTSRCFCSHLRAPFQQFFEPHQFGVAIPGGLEQVVHSMHCHIHSDIASSPSVVLKLDCENAFNQISRTTILSQVAEHFPSLSPWVHACYSVPSQLFISPGTPPILSSSGVQQGDPLAPALYALALQAVLSEVRSGLSSLPTLDHWYLDDGCLAGDPTVVFQYFELLQLHGPAHGIHLNLDKCELYSLAALPTDPFPLHFRRLIGPATGFSLLGSPFGAQSWVHDFFTTHVSRLLDLLSHLPSLDHPQIAFHLLRSCFSSCRVVHLLRTTPAFIFDAVSPFCATIDIHVRSALETLLLTSISDSVWQQATFPVKGGGLGLLSCVSSAPAAYLGSLSSASASLPSLGHSFTAQHPLWVGACRQLPPTSPPQASPLDLFQEVPTQRSLHRGLVQSEWDILLVSSNTRDRNRLQSLTLPGAGAFLLAMPNPNLGNEFQGSHFCALLQWRLGCPVYAPDTTCAQCGHPLDALGDHSLTCPKGFGFYARHNTMRDCMFDILKSGDLHVEKERGVDASQRRPADLYVHQWSRGRDLVLDVTIGHSAQRCLLHMGGTRAGVALEAGRARKNPAKRLCEGLGFHYRVLGLETFGGMSSEVLEIMGYVSKRLALRQVSPPHLILNRLLQRASVTFAHALARTLLVKAAVPVQAFVSD